MRTFASYTLMSKLQNMVKEGQKSIDKSQATFDKNKKMLNMDIFSFEPAIKKALGEHFNPNFWHQSLYISIGHLDLSLKDCTYKSFTECVHNVLEEVDKLCFEEEIVKVIKFYEPTMSTDYVRFQCRIKLPYGTTLNLEYGTTPEKAGCKFEYDEKQEISVRRTITNIICED